MRASARDLSSSILIYLARGSLKSVPVSSQPYNNCNASTYYSTLSTSLPTTSRDELHTLIKSTHRNEVPYTSSSQKDVWDALIDLDTDSSGQNIHLIYSNKYVPAHPHDSGTCGYWNREHLWPRSRGVGESGKDNTDMHHLRPADCNVNSARSNRLFGTCGITEKEDECIIPAHAEAAYDTERDSYTFLPPREKRGDIARAIFYMDLRYDGSDSNTVDLVVSDCPESVPNDAGMGYLSQLLQWHIDDPVDEEEMTRNEKVCTDWQGNRNPFVDYPELVEEYFGNALPVPQDGAGYDCSIGNTNSSTGSSSKPTASSTPKPTNQPVGTPEDGLIITGVIDGPLPGGLPKAVEFYAAQNLSDLSQYGVGFANNGGGSPGVEFTFPSDSIVAGSYISLSYEGIEYLNFFGVVPDYVTGHASINGDDAVELFYNGKVVDVFGDVSVDGTGTAWEYMDGWAYRKHGSRPSTIFNTSHWTFSGTNGLYSCSSNVGCKLPFPEKSFQASSTASNHSTIPNSSVLSIRDKVSVLIFIMTFCFMYLEAGSS